MQRFFISVTVSLSVFLSTMSITGTIFSTNLSMKLLRPKSFICRKVSEQTWERPLSNLNVTRKLSSFDLKGKEGPYYLRSNSGSKISFWHDVPLQSEANYYNMVVEIPKFSKRKMEISKTMELNPIIQDSKDGSPRFYAGPIYWNYGSLPRTWEDPDSQGNDDALNAYGDNDPLDVVEIGSKPFSIGSTIEIKPLGALCMIDQGELDWKIIALQRYDPKLDLIKDVEDIDYHYPGTISGIREWFRWYKTSEGKPKNIYGYMERALSSKEAINIINEAHTSYKNLVNSRFKKKTNFWIN